MLTTGNHVPTHPKSAFYASGTNAVGVARRVPSFPHRFSPSHPANRLSGRFVRFFARHFFQVQDSLLALASGPVLRRARERESLFR